MSVLCVVGDLSPVSVLCVVGELSPVSMLCVVGDLSPMYALCYVILICSTTRVDYLYILFLFVNALSFITLSGGHYNTFLCPAHCTMHHGKLLLCFAQ